MNRLIAALAAAALLLAGCASNTPSVDRGPTPAAVVAGGKTHGEVLWGGQIVSVSNLAERTRIEVLALPLDEDGRPNTAGKAEGRFVVDKPGFLEPREYAANRLLTVRGRLQGFTEGQVGAAPYRYPLVSGDQLTLWPDAGSGAYGTVRPRINFGIGTGSYGSGVGIGIGF